MLVNEMTGKVVYLGPTEPGKKHDKKAGDEARLSTSPRDTRQGYRVSGYEPPGVLTQPTKKKRQVRKECKRQVLQSSHFECPVRRRNVIAGVKRGSDCQRCLTPYHRGPRRDLVMEIACGLHNLRVHCVTRFPHSIAKA